MNINSERARFYRACQIERYLVLHGESPLCVCGCGEHVRFDRNGRPNRYVNGHQGHTTKIHLANEARAAECIAIGPFRSDVKRLRVLLGLSWAETADLVGLTQNHLNSVMFSRRHERVGRDLARTILEPMLREHQRRLRDDASRRGRLEASLPGSRLSTSR